jgi:hypothetical protein
MFNKIWIWMIKTGQEGQINPWLIIAVLKLKDLIMKCLKVVKIIVQFYQQFNNVFFLIEFLVIKNKEQ